MATWDIVRGGFLEGLQDLLDPDVHVMLMYGDRDYIGNCIRALLPSPKDELIIPHWRNTSLDA